MQPFKTKDLKEITVASVILAAGKGTRMNSTVPKALISFGGSSMLEHCTNLLSKSNIKEICVVVSDPYSDFLPFMDLHKNLAYCTQGLRNGTGGAAGSAAGFLGISPPEYASGKLLYGKKTNSEYVLFYNADVPAMSPSVINQLILEAISTESDICVLGVVLPNPFGYGRLVLEDEKLKAIIEEKDANPEEKALTACNSGIILMKIKALEVLLPFLENKNSQQEYYLTDCIKLGVEKKYKVTAHVSCDWELFRGANDPTQLKELELFLKNKSQQQEG